MMGSLMYRAEVTRAGSSKPIGRRMAGGFGVGGGEAGIRRHAAGYRLMAWQSLRRGDGYGAVLFRRCSDALRQKQG